MLEVISIGSDNIVRLDQLTNASTEAFVNTATVTFTLKDDEGTTVLGATSMPYVAASDGRYEGNIDDATALIENDLYVVEITATSGATVLFRKISCVAKYRANK